MHIRSMLAVSAVALAVGTGFGATGAMAQSECQSRISAVQARVEAYRDSDSGHQFTTQTYGTKSQQIPEALMNTGQPGDFHSTVEQSQGTTTRHELWNELRQAQTLCNEGRTADANEVLARIESDLSASRLGSAEPAAGE